jgi:hypothetical protein
LREHRQVDDDTCPECGGEFGPLWRVSVRTNMHEYTPVFGGPVVLDIARCNGCNVSFERAEGQPWRRQDEQ